MSFIKTNRQVIILLILGIVFLFIYSWFSFVTTQDGKARFASPDGVANYFWAERYAEGEKLFYFEPLNVIANDIVVPRSVRSDNGVVKPVSFLGIILIYGFLGKIFGSWIIIYLTPFFAVIGVLFFYGIIKKIFDEKTAFISALMLFCLASYWYYASRSMFHNVLFIDLLLAGVYFVINSARIKQVKKINTNFIFIFFAGIFIGLAIITRTSELIWLLPVILLAWIVYFKQLHWNKSILFVCGIFLALIPMFYYNQILYGDFLKFGYSKIDTVKAQNEVVISNVDINNGGGMVGFTEIMRKFLPSDINIKQAGKSFIYYYVIMFWYLFWPAFFGGVYFLWHYKKRSKEQQLYFISFIVISVVLVLYYGSWIINDNPNKLSVTIGNSYTRYFLPMYIMSIPLAVLFFTQIPSWLTKKIKSMGIQFPLRELDSLTAIFVIVFFMLNFQAIMLAKEEGLIVIKNNLIKDSALVEKMFAPVELEAVIISERFDKFLWPSYAKASEDKPRKVITGNFTNKEHNAEYAKLAEYGVPLYYFGFIFPKVDMEYLNNKRLKEFGLKIEAVELDEVSGLGLYKLVHKVESLPAGRQCP